MSITTSTPVAVIPLNATPSQTVNVTLANQPVTLNVYAKTIGIKQADGSIVQTALLFLDLLVNDALIIGGLLCLNEVPMVLDKYWGFIGDLMFVDSQGTNDPTYDGIGTRYWLLYLPA